jgi:hypothetical protein
MIEKFTKVLLVKVVKFGNTLSPYVETQDRALLMLKVYYYFPNPIFESIKEAL